MQVPPAAQASPSFDPTVATDAYLATVPPDKRARSDAYFEGGYWLQLWNFLYGTIDPVEPARVRLVRRHARSGRGWTRKRPLQTLIYWVQFNVVSPGRHVSVDRVRRLLPRTPIRPRHADVLAVDVGSNQGLRTGAGVRRSAAHGALRRAAPRRPIVVALGDRRRRRVQHPRRRDRAGVHRAAVQHLHAAHRPGRFAIRSSGMARSNGIKADALYVVDAVPPDHEDQRQRQRLPRHRADQPERQPAETRRRSKRSKRCWDTRWVTTCLNHLFKNILESSLVVAIGFALVGAGVRVVRAGVTASGASRRSATSRAFR